jgi:hypothetical protein
VRELFSAFEFGQSPFVNLGDSGEGADVFAILLRDGLQVLDFTMQQFEIHCKGFQPLIDGHLVSV